MKWILKMPSIVPTYKKAWWVVTIIDQFSRLTFIMPKQKVGNTWENQSPEHLG